MWILAYKTEQINKVRTWEETDLYQVQLLQPNKAADKLTTP